MTLPEETQRRTARSGELDGFIRQALTLRAGRAAPGPDGWSRLRARVEAMRSARLDSLLTLKQHPPETPTGFAPRVSSGCFYYGGHGYHAPGAITTWVQVDALLLAWRLPSGVSLAAGRLV
ncbi:MAG: hypothetical protein HY023_16045 [Chloroflexi bacterium]|nr:hypothetical protein [Chloroflexota bacterium]